VHDIGSQFDIIIFSNLWCIKHHLKKGYVVPSVVAVPIIGTMCANFPNHATITKMALWLCDSGRNVMKSMNILCHGSHEIGNNVTC
jgi:hypothetical protein